MEVNTIGSRIRQKRLEKGCSQHALAEKAQIGCVYLSEIERDHKMPSINSVIKIATALDISADYILRGTQPPTQENAHNALTEKLDSLTPKQLHTVHALFRAYVDNLE